MVSCACKEFLHSYSQSLQFQLSKTKTKVIELMPLLVETPMSDSMEQKEGFDTMPVDKFTADVQDSLDMGEEQITQGQASQMRFMSRLLGDKFTAMIYQEFTNETAAVDWSFVLLSSC